MLSFFKKLFVKEVIVPVFPSELSNPRTCKRTYTLRWKDELAILRILQNRPMKATEIDRHYGSGGRCANHLYQDGYLENIGTPTRFIYKINDKWYDLLLKLEK